jgi:hypothetical protein
MRMTQLSQAIKGLPADPTDEPDSSKHIVERSFNSAARAHLGIHLLARGKGFYNVCRYRGSQICREDGLVRTLETETRRILEFCELDFEPACLEFHRNPNPSATASAPQVRRPLYDSSIALWRHYEREFMPLREALIDAGIPPGEPEA